MNTMKGPAFYNEDFLIIKEDYEALKERLKRILMTLPGERVNNPTFGSVFKRYLFNFDTEFLNRFKYVIKQDLEKWEPTIFVEDIEVNLNESKIARINIIFRIIATGDQITYDLLLE